MFDRDLVASGFDVETLVSETYLSHLLLAQVEAGLLPLQLNLLDPITGINYLVLVHTPDQYPRRYDPHPDAVITEWASQAFQITLLPEGAPAHLQLRLKVSVHNADTHAVLAYSQPMDLLFNLELHAEIDEQRQLEYGHYLKFDFISLSAETTTRLIAAHLDPETVEQRLRQFIPQRTSLGVAQGQTVRRIRLRRFVDGAQRSIGFYIDLALHSAPGLLLGERGDETTALDFRPADAHIAFSTGRHLFGLLGPDFKARQAVSDGEDGWSYPLREDITNPDSPSIGTLKSVWIGPEIIYNTTPNNPPATPTATTTGRLCIKIEGEYEPLPADPDFTARMLLRPLRDAEGIVDWDMDVDVEFGLLGTLLSLAVGIVLGIVFVPFGVSWFSAITVGLLVGLAVVKEMIAEPYASKIVEDKVDAQAQAGILDVLPFRLPGATRRWDPFYTTQHQVVALLDEDVVVDELGIAFFANRLSLDKQPVPQGDVYIRDEERDAEAVSALRYEVLDFASQTASLAAIAPGTDRMDYLRRDAIAEPTLVTLSLEQIAERIAAKRLFAPINYTAERIHLVDGQIDDLLMLSRRERNNLSNRLVRDFRNQMRAVVVTNYSDSLREDERQKFWLKNNRQPTGAELKELLDARIERVLDGLVSEFRKQLLPGLLDKAIARTLRFDLAPEEMAALQKAGICVLDGTEIVERTNAEGDKVPYYRDHPDQSKEDNLLSKRHYTPPWVPPAQ